MIGKVERGCWCGNQYLGIYSDEYRVCRNCGTLVSRAEFSPQLYETSYWQGRQTEHHGLPDIKVRARLDLPERCAHWLQRLLSLRLPPARVLELGCAHGGYVALLGWAGFDAVGLELSPGVARYARQTFGTTVLEGPVEDQRLAPGSFDVVVLNDVIEHLPDPLGTLTYCANLLAPGGFFVVQTPEYKEHLEFDDLKDSGDLFLKHMEGNNDEHLFLFSRRSASVFFSQLGLPVLDFSEPIYSYDMSFVASKTTLIPSTETSVSAALERAPVGRLVQALLDKSRESKDRWWAIHRLGGKA